jgi:hypothetical protein
MDYFHMCTDTRIKGRMAQPTELRALRDKSREEIEQQPPINRYIESSRVAYPDIIVSPVLLVAEKLKKIMEKYQADAYFKTVVLIEKEKNVQNTYYFIQPPNMDCTAEGGKALDQVKVGSARIFTASGMSGKLIVRLDVAESILRRSPDGVWFEKLDVV